MGRKKIDPEKKRKVTGKNLTFRVKRSLPPQTLDRIEALFRDCERRGMTASDVLNDMLVWFVEYQTLKGQIHHLEGGLVASKPQQPPKPATIEEVMATDLPQKEKEHLIIDIASKMAKESGRKSKPPVDDDDDINLFDLAEETSTFLKR